MNIAELISALLDEMIFEQGTDLYLHANAPPSMRIGDQLRPMHGTPISASQIDAICEYLLPEDKHQEFLSQLELNYSFAWQGRARFRANCFRQQQTSGLVIRRIHTEVPQLENLNLPEAYAKLIMHRSGLILVCGQAGSGKSTSLAAMLDHRNRFGSGHIVTVEDPIEYVHTPNQCLFTQRDVGIDTYSFAAALKNVLRQRPDVVVIGEIRDADVMSLALSTAETGHLCIASLHASNSSKAVERMLDFFAEDRQHQVLKSLSTQLRGILSQRLVDYEGEKLLACEILLNEGAVPSLIAERKLPELRDLVSKSRGQGMVTFDQSLLELVIAGRLDEATALIHADSSSELSFRIRQWRVEQATTAPAGSRLLDTRSPTQF